MKISELFKKDEGVYSFEFFPPKTEKGRENLLQAVNELKPLNPDFVSVTYGALGSSQEKSLELIETIHNKMDLNVMAHYTCIGATQEKVDDFLMHLEKMGIENILALRGDVPEGADRDEVLGNTEFSYGVDLVRYIRKKTDRFSVGVAGYPQSHPECHGDMKKDLEFLLRKVDAGADFVVTQLFFDNDCFLRFRDAAYKIGVRVPIIPGIMPIEQYKQIEKITSMSGVPIPDEVKNIFENEAMSEEEKKRVSIAYTTKQCQKLLREGVRGIHFYTLNKSNATRQIFKKLHG